MGWGKVEVEGGELPTLRRLKFVVKWGKLQIGEIVDSAIKLQEPSRSNDQQEFFLPLPPAAETRLCKILEEVVV